MLPAILATYVALPILVGFIYFARTRASMKRPRLFLAGGILEGIIIFAAVFYWAIEPLTSMGISGVAPGDPTAAGPLGPYDRALLGLPISGIAHLFVLWATHRGVARA